MGAVRAPFAFQYSIRDAGSVSFFGMSLTERGFQYSIRDARSLLKSGVPEDKLIIAFNTLLEMPRRGRGRGSRFHGASFQYSIRDAPTVYSWEEAVTSSIFQYSIRDAGPAAARLADRRLAPFNTLLEMLSVVVIAFESAKGE